MQSGWVKLHRGLLEWEWYKDANTRGLFIHCLLRANHADNSWRGKEIKRGSFFTSLDTLSTETGLTSRQIRTSLDKLISTGEVSSSGQARGRMITIANYDGYQSDDRLDDNEKAGRSQADDRQTTTNKNDKNDKKVITTTPVKPKYEDCDKNFADWCLTEIQKVIPDFKVKSIDSWAKTARDIRVLDEIDMNEAGRVWRWCVNDSFERANVQSMTKLRKRYMNLREKAKGASNETSGRPTTARPDNSTTGRTRANGAKRLAEIAAQIAEISGNDTTVADDGGNVFTQMD